ncbi:MAG TPA: hypothetical protein VGO56_12450 [Pyrinomonadaceae bacterium]|jgi:hypothetical protein|nr:hypothetical protein [Pyrinomonadaceae bacterium]
MKAFLISLGLVLTSLLNSTLIVSKSTTQESQAPSTCEEAAAEVVRFKELSSQWGPGKGGDTWLSTKHTSAEGESYWEGFNFYKSDSRFKNAVRQISESVEGLAGWKPLFDAQGHQIGQRVVKETRTDGKITNVLIQRITDRAIRGISAASWKVALAAEMATITCPAAAEKNAK